MYNRKISRVMHHVSILSARSATSPPSAKPTTVVSHGRTRSEMANEVEEKCGDCTFSSAIILSKCVLMKMSYSACLNVF